MEPNTPLPRPDFPVRFADLSFDGKTLWEWGVEWGPQDTL